MERNLRRTWYEISEYLNSDDSNPLRIIELINRVPQCNWTFRFRFDKSDRINLSIDCDFDLSDDCALELLDGSLDELLFAETVYLRHSGNFLVARTSQLIEEPPSSNCLTFTNTGEKADSLLILAGFCMSDSIPREMQANSYSCVRRYFLENTWLGSSDSVGSDYGVSWDVLKEVEWIRPANRYERKMSSLEKFTTRIALKNSNGEHIGEASLQTSPLLEHDEIYTKFGRLVPQPRSWLSSCHDNLHWIVEIGSQELRQAIMHRAPTRKLISQLVKSVNDALADVMRTDSFRDFERELQRKQQTKAANRLKQRQRRAQLASKVIFKGEPLMLVPENENEVLALLCKLESRRALPFHEFILLEYTARVGIDAIGTYQIKETDVPAQFASIELEHYFENFLDHEHPPSLVNLLICWDFRDGEAPKELHQHCNSEYLYEYRNDHSITVVVLSNIPGLQTQ